MVPLSAGRSVCAAALIESVSSCASQTACREDHHSAAAPTQKRYLAPFQNHSAHQPVNASLIGYSALVNMVIR